MEKVNRKTTKLCSFYVSDWHLVTMILPYLNEEINKENKIVTLLEKNIKEKVETLVKKLNLKNSKQILNINWNIIKTKKYLELKNILNNESKGEKNITIMVNGTKKFIDNIGKNIERWTEQNKSVSNIKIINCYEITEFNYNITEILDEHDKYLTLLVKEKNKMYLKGMKKERK